MIDCISVENMRQSDAYTIANFVPGLELMYRAACGVFQSVDWHGKILIAAGSGNNGGDGYALACILKEQGYDCCIWSVGSRLSDDSRHYAEIARGLGIEIVPFDFSAELSGFDFIVDCLLGTGFHGALRADYRTAIERINSSGSFTVSVDINSGMNGDTGEAEIAVRSNLTVAIGYIKNGLVTEPAGKYMKQLVCVDIGIILVRQENMICFPEEWPAFCRRMNADASLKAINSDGRIYFCAPVWLKLPEKI